MPLRLIIPFVARLLFATPAARQVIIVITKNAPRIPVLGKLIPILSISALVDAEAERALKRNFKLEQKKKFRDESHVVTCAAVKLVLEQELGEGKIVWQAAQGAVRAILPYDANMFATQSPADVETRPAGQILGQGLMDKIREKALKQTEKRKRVTYRYSKRAI
jgi:hypothetical protein